MRLRLAVLSLLVTLSASADSLPGIRTEVIAVAADFVSSIAADSKGTIYYSTTSGSIFRLDGSDSVRVATVNTLAQSDSGLLGMALIDDDTAAVHYTNPQITREVVAKVDLTTGATTVLAEFVADHTAPDRPVSGEHHGGNPVVAPDGSIFFSVGDYGGPTTASDPAWTSGKIWRVYPDGTKEQFALGVRNVFDLAWDEANQRVVFTDNGPVQGDEINVGTKGSHFGWPVNWGNRNDVPGTVAPIYVFPDTIAPTGIHKLSGRNPWLRGYVFGGFMSAGIYAVRDIDARPLPDPLPIMTGVTQLIIDVTELPNGDVIFATFETIERLVLPRRGDCNGDGKLDAADLDALATELLDGASQGIDLIHGGAYAGSFGCDANLDRIVDSSDRASMLSAVRGRVRSVKLQ